MKFYTAFLSLFLVMISQSNANRISLRAFPKVVIEGSESLTMSCKVPSKIDNLYIGAIVILERSSGNDSVLIARQRSQTEILSGDNRTSAEGNLSDDTQNGDTYLQVVINEPTAEEQGTYKCKFIYVDNQYAGKTLSAKIDVKYLEEAPESYFPQEGNSGCDCPDVWAEIDSLKAALAAKSDGPNGAVAAAGNVDAGCQVSFAARFQDKFTTQINNDANAVFDDVTTNRGDAYDPTTGEFTAPCDGQYYFSLTMRSVQRMDSGQVSAVIQADGQDLSQTAVYLADPIDHYESASTGTVATLKKGSKVAVYVTSTSYGEFTGAGYSVFTGFFLSP